MGRLQKEGSGAVDSPDDLTELSGSNSKRPLDLIGRSSVQDLISNAALSGEIG
jgi:hypothetical protein